MGQALRLASLMGLLALGNLSIMTAAPNPSTETSPIAVIVNAQGVPHSITLYVDDRAVKEVLYSDRIQTKVPLTPGTHILSALASYNYRSSSMANMKVTVPSIKSAENKSALVLLHP